MRRILRSIGSVYASSIVSGLLGAAFVPVAYHSLGAQGYGLLSVYTILSSYLALFELGISKNLSRLVASEPSSQATHQELYRTTIGLYVLVSISMIILLPATIYVVGNYLFPIGNNKSLPAVVALAVVEYILAIPTNVIQAKSVAFEDFKGYSKFKMLTGIYRYGLLIVGALLLHNPVALICTLLVRRLLDWGTARRFMGSLPPGAWVPIFSLKRFKLILRDSSLFSLAQVLQITALSVGASIVAHLGNVGQLGTYSSAYDLASKVLLLSNAVGFVAFPRLVKLLGQTESKILSRVLPSLSSASWTLYMFIATLGVLVSQPLLNILGLHGAIYEFLFDAILLGICFNAHANLSYELLQAQKRLIAASFASAIPICVMTLLVAICYTRTGVVAAVSWAWVVSQFVYSAAVERVAVKDLVEARTKSLVIVVLKRSIWGVAISGLVWGVTHEDGQIYVWLTGVLSVFEAGVLITSGYKWIVAERRSRYMRLED